MKSARQGPRKMKTPPSPHICSNIEGGAGGEPLKKKIAPPNEKRPKKYISAWAGDQSAFFFFFRRSKNRRFSAPKTKNRLFRRAPKEQRPTDKLGTDPLTVDDMDTVCSTVRLPVLLSRGSMYVCMYCHHIQQSMGQPGKVANPARGQLNGEN